MPNAHNLYFELDNCLSQKYMAFTLKSQAKLEWSTRWADYSLGDLCLHATSGGTPATANSSFYGGDIPWLRTQEVNFNFIKDTEIKITEVGLEKSSAKWIPKNSVIIALYGNSAGRVAVNKIPLTTNQACGNFIVNPKKADYRFIYYALMNNYDVLRN